KPLFILPNLICRRSSIQDSATATGLDRIGVSERYPRGRRNPACLRKSGGSARNPPLIRGVQAHSPRRFRRPPDRILLSSFQNVRNRGTSSRCGFSLGRDRTILLQPRNAGILFHAHLVLCRSLRPRLF